VNHKNLYHEKGTNNDPGTADDFHQCIRIFAGSDLYEKERDH
jgi:hypothetical protein